MDGGSAGFAGAVHRSTAMDGGSAGFAGAVHRSNQLIYLGLCFSLLIVAKNITNFIINN